MQETYQTVQRVVAAVGARNYGEAREVLYALQKTEMPEGGHALVLSAITALLAMNFGRLEKDVWTLRRLLIKALLDASERPAA